MIPRPLLSLLLVVLVACGASARETTIRTTYTGVTALQAGFLAWDLEHQRDLTRGVTTVADGLAKLDAYKTAREPVLKAFDVVYRALAAAAIVSDDPKSLPGAIAAADQLRLAICRLAPSAPVLCPGGTP